MIRSGCLCEIITKYICSLTLKKTRLYDACLPIATPKESLFVGPTVHYIQVRLRNSILGNVLETDTMHTPTKGVPTLFLSSFSFLSKRGSYCFGFPPFFLLAQPS